MHLRWPKAHSSLLSQRVRNSTTVSPASLIKTSIIPAPHAGSIKVLSLNRPSARNAISLQLLAELSKETKALQDEGKHGPTRVMILASESDSCFCAGADLKVLFSIMKYLCSTAQAHNQI